MPPFPACCKARCVCLPCCSAHSPAMPPIPHTPVQESGQGVLHAVGDPGEEEEFEIDLNDTEPEFLKGAR